MATLESESSPRCPTIKIDTTCKRYCRIVTTTIGAAIDGMQEPLAIYICVYTMLLCANPTIVSEQSRRKISFLTLQLEYLNKYIKK